LEPFSAFSLKEFRTHPTVAVSPTASFVPGGVSVPVGADAALLGWADGDEPVPDFSLFW